MFWRNNPHSLYVLYKLVGLYDVEKSQVSSVMRTLHGIIKKESRKSELSILLIICDYMTAKYGVKPPGENRATSRIIDVFKMIPANYRPRNALDFGCGDCSNGAELAKVSDKVTGVDIWELQNAPQGVQYFVIKPDDFTLPGTAYDLVICLQVLHHLNDARRWIAEISKKMITGGYLVIREHDLPEQQSDSVVDMLNMLHASMFLSDKKGEFSKTQDVAEYIKTIRYNSAKEWNTVITSCGFKLNKVLLFDGNNPQHIYYASYIKQ